MIIENLETVRYIVGGLIGVLSIVWLITRPRSFHQTLAGEMSNKKFKKIKKQVSKLKEENDKAQRLLKTLNKATTIINKDISTDNSELEITEDHESNIMDNKATILRPFVKPKSNETKGNLGPYDMVKLYMESGMGKEIIHEKTGVPMAEIDLILKFNRLNKMSQHKNRFENKILAYG
jgi:uncharacterized membrane-anchored protein YhcB (DUF1043 family)